MSGDPRPIRVLHVDDEPDFAAMAAEFLERVGEEFAVESVTSARDGLDRMEEARFDCVVSDYDMPGTDGLELLEAVREDDPDLPFIFFTGKGSEEIASRAISAGVTDYLQKSSTSEQYKLLANRIRNAVAQERAERRADETEQRLQELSAASNDILWLFSADGGELLFVNDAYETIWGRSDDALAEEPRDFLAGVHPDGRGRVRAGMDAPSDGESVDIEFRVNAAEDYGRWVWVQATPVYDAGGGVSRVAGFARDITERKQHERRFRAFVEQSTDLISVLGPDGTIQYQSPAIERWLGYEPEALVGESVTDYVHPDDRDRVGDQFERMLETPDTTATVEFRVRTADGDWRWLAAQWNDQRSNPAVEGIVVNSRDVTDRKRREMQLREERTFNELALDSILDVHWVLDTDGHVTDWSDEGGTATGYTPEDAVGMHATEFFPERERACVEGKLEELETTGSVTANAEFRREDGELVPYRFDGTALTDEDGVVERLCGFGRDVSEQVERERRLREERDLLEQLVDTVPDIFYVADTDGSLRDWNSRLEAVTGYGEDDLAEMGATEFFAEADRERIGTAIEEALASGQATVEAGLETADGERIPYEFTGGRLTAEDGTVTGLVGVGRDIGDRKNRERELERQNDRLERFASVVSHDLRNPLNVAQGNIRLVLEDEDDERLEVAGDAVDRSLALIEDVLSLARQGEAAEELDAVDLASVVEGCWRTVTTADATLVVETEQTIQADASRLKRLLENLFDNAVSHAGDDVTITVGPLDDGFHVADDGPGIPAGDREQVFEAGYSSTETNTGFGLNIVQEIAAAHGWTVGVTAGDAGGARFEITGLTDGE